MMIPTLHDIAVVNHITRLLDEAYQHWADTDSDQHCKSEEGRVEIVLPNWFQRRHGETGVGVNVFSYVLGPHRMHYFDSPEEALEAVREWHAEELSLDMEGENR